MRARLFVINLGFLLGCIVSSDYSWASPSKAVAARITTLNVFDRAQVRVVPGLEEALVAVGPTGAAENLALDEAVAKFRRPPTPGADMTDIVQPFIQFMTRFPKSNWNSVLSLNLGLSYYRTGRFSAAIDSFDAAWRTGRNAKTPEAMAMVDRAVGELAVMYSRVGEQGKLQKLLDETRGRVLQGSATELVASARESLWSFKNEPGFSYLCGPAALRNLLQQLDYPAAKISELDAVRSPQGGFSLSSLSALATKAGLPHRLIYRPSGTDVPVPSIVNWKVSHYAAIVEERNGQYLIKDPTFGTGDFWASKASIDAETTGYFLVAAEQPSGAEWRVAAAEEAATIFGKGSTAKNYRGAYTPNDVKLHPDQCPIGMCVANAMLMLASVNLTDSPVGYVPQKGPSARVRLTYNQKEGLFPANFGYFGVGPKWNINFLSFVQDDPRDYVNKVVNRYELGGGVIEYPLQSFLGGQSANAEPLTGNIMRRFPGSGIPARYEVTRPDGGKYIYSLSDGATSGLRRIFLTQILDPAGNALTLNYDATLRLTSFTDATGRNTIFTYAPNSRRITAITDPFGRRATLDYNDVGHLAAITDVIGLKSSFLYTYSLRDIPQGIDAYTTPGGYQLGNFVTIIAEGPGYPGAPIGRGEYIISSMHTPYGTTKFQSSWDDKANTRSLSIIDPLEQTERIEFRHDAPGIAAFEADGPDIGLTGVICCPPAGDDGGRGHLLNFRNTFHWDKHIYKIAPGDYTKARITHWFHQDLYPYISTSGRIESTKAPLENRVGYYYSLGMTSFTLPGGRTPNFILRKLDNGTQQVYHQLTNINGGITSAIDPIGREFFFDYDGATPVDLTNVHFRNGGSLANLTYNSQHKPLTYTDAAGQLTSFAYNAAGQTTSATNALSQTTSYERDLLGRLITVINANGRAQWSLTYDAFDRVLTRTDSEGYTLVFTYDAMDRITRVTYPDNTTTEVSYERLDASSIKDRLGRVTKYVYDANRQLVSRTDPLGRLTAYAYYETGVLKSITDPKGNVTSWDVDLQSRPVAKRYADGTSETYAYEPKAGRLRTITDARGRSKQYSYAADNRVIGISYSDGLTANVTYTYDSAVPRLVSMTDGLGVTKFAYGSLGSPGGFRLISEDGPYNNDTVVYGYDKLGRHASRIIDSTTETFEYDALGRVIRNVNGLGAFGTSYLGQTQQPVSMASPTVGTTWSYLDNVGDRRLDAIGQIGAGRGFSYTTTAENRITGMKEGVSGAAFTQAWSYNYDDADRLTRASPLSGGRSDYSYDTADNLTSIGGSAATYNSGNQIKTLGGVPYSYDAAGNLLDDGTRTYSWDGENRLTSIGYKDQPGRTSTFRYDGLGRRLAMVETSTGGSAETRFLWCGGATPCQARNVGDTTTGRFYQQGVAISAGAKLYFVRDHLGSVRDVLDAQTGTKISSYDFEAFGKQLGAGLPVDFGFAGMFNHQASGLNLTMFRPYDPKSGRWLSRDPIGESLGPSLYAYAEDSPTNKTDPFGLAPPQKLYAILFALSSWLQGGLEGESGLAKALAKSEENNIALQTERMNKRGALSCGPPPPLGPEDVLEFIVRTPVLLVEFLLQFQTNQLLRNINGEPLNQMY